MGGGGGGGGVVGKVELAIPLHLFIKWEEKAKYRDLELGVVISSSISVIFQTSSISFLFTTLPSSLQQQKQQPFLSRICSCCCLDYLFIFYFLNDMKMGIKKVTKNHITSLHYKITLVLSWKIVFVFFK